MRLVGKATKKETAAYAARFDNVPYNHLPQNKLQVCQVGFGGYRINDDDPDHEAALSFALQNGVNLIDTSSNYANGRSEQLIGQVLGKLVRDQKLKRQNIVLVSKVGYLQGDNYQLAQERKAAGRPFPNLVKYSAGLDHCIHPDFLDDQLSRTLERLGIETLDFYLLHNPEYYLSWAKVANIPIEEAKKEYYRRIRLAFEHLETEVERGRIQAYGISSNTFPAAAQAYNWTSLAEVLEIAEALSTHHHFQVIQLPANLYETAAFTENNMPDSKSTVSFAHQHHLGVLINRPLNAFYQEQLIRLADVIPPSYPTSVEEVSTLVDTLESEEAKFVGRWLSNLTADKETQEQLQQYLALGQILNGKWQGFGSYQNWRDIQGHLLIPRAQAAIQFLSNAENSPAKLLKWLEGYIKLFNETIAAVSAFYQEQGSKQVQQIHQTAVAADPAWEARTLSQTAVRALRSTEGVHCVLVGMRQPRYVEDMLADLARPIEAKARQEAWQKLWK